LLTERILVLGGAGFLGSAILHSLSKNGSASLTCGDIRPPSQRGVEYINIDLLHDEFLAPKLQGYDIIINCVGQIAFPFSQTLELNSLGMLNLTEALKDSDSHLIHISSVSVYGSVDVCDESTPINPETKYATAKAIAEKILEQNFEKSKLTILRLSNLYGNGQQKGVVAYLIRSFEGDQTLKFNNAGDLIRSYLHIQDCVSFINSFINNSGPSGIFNIVGPVQYTILELVSLAENVLNIRYEVSYHEVPAWENIRSISGDKVLNIYRKRHIWNLENYLKKKVNSHGE